MGTLSSTSAATYRLLYVQPEPEQGDRVCVGLVFEENSGRFSMLYDNDLQKLRCVAPAVDLDLVRFYLEDLRGAVRDSGDLDAVIRRYAPQVSMSAQRSVRSPVSDIVRVSLLERFAIPHKAPAFEQLPKSNSRKRVAEEIAGFVGPMASRLHLTVNVDASPEALFGKPMPRVSRVPASIRGRHGIVLVDGVDLRTVKPRAAVTMTNRVVHNFWQYGRLRGTDLVAQQTPFKRVAVLLNGAPVKTDAYADAHDYAIDQFRKESDLTVDGSSFDDKERLEELLATEA